MVSTTFAGSQNTLRERQTAAARFIAALGALVVGYYTINNIRHGELLQFSIDVTFLAFFIVAFIAAARFPTLVSFSLPVATSTLCVIVAILFGRQSGSQIFLLVIGPISALVLGGRRPYSILACTIVATLLLLGIQFLVPDVVRPDIPFLQQVRNPFTDGLALTQQDIFYIVNISSIEFGVGLCTYLAMHWAATAEAALAREYARSELLLQNLLPSSIAARLKDNPNGIIAENFDFISILFADVVNFTLASSSKKPEDIIKFLSRLFGEFDELAERHGLEKIKTIGDCYMVAGGMPEKSEGHTQAMAEMALDMIAVSERLTAEFDTNVSIRIGLHVGPAVAGVIGHNKPYYDVWGDTINVASRMESSSVPGRIQITPEVKEILGARYDFESRGVVDIKGKGPMTPYFLVGKSADARR